MGGTLANYDFFNTEVLSGNYLIDLDNAYILLNIVWKNLLELLVPLSVSYFIMAALVLALAPLMWIMQRFFKNTLM